MNTNNSNKGRSASQVLQDDSTITSVKVWGKRSYRCVRLRCAYSCLDLANTFKKMGRSTKVSDWTQDVTVTKALESNNKWQLWRRFFKKAKHNDKSGKNDVMSKEESKENRKVLRQRRNAAVFMPDYEEEQTAQHFYKHKRDSLELCDLEDSGNFDMISNDDNK